MVLTEQLQCQYQPITKAAKEHWTIPDIQDKDLGGGPIHA
jgi:hypothetical protein